MAVHLYSLQASSAPVEPLLQAMQDQLASAEPSPGLLDDLFSFTCLKHGYSALMTGQVHEPLLAILS